MLIKYFQQMVLLLIIPTTIIMMMLTLRLQQMNMMMLTLRLQQMNTMMLTLQLHQMNTMMLTLRLHHMNTMMLIIQLQQMKLGINPPILGNLMLLLLQLHNGLIKPLLQNWLQPLLLSGQLHQLSGQLQAKLQHILIEKTMPDLIKTDHLLYRRNSE